MYKQFYQKGKVYGEGYSFSHEKLKELSVIKSEIEFKEKYFPSYIIEKDRNIEVVEYSER